MSLPDPGPFPRVLHEAAKPKPLFRHYGCAGSDLTHACGHQKSPASAGLSFAGRSPDRAANTGPSLRRYLAPRRRVSISMTMNPAATMAAFKFNVSAKVGGGTEELEKRAHPTIRSLQDYAAVHRLER